MKYALILISVLMGSIISAEPILDVRNAFNGSYRDENNNILIDRELQRVRRLGIEWCQAYWWGNVFWVANDADGNVILTWDWVDYLPKDKQPDYFVLIYNEPTLGKSWNPDGVTIRIDAIDEIIHIKGKEYKADKYVFIAPDGSIGAETYVTRGVGIIRASRTIYGTIKMYDRILE